MSWASADVVELLRGCVAGLDSAWLEFAKRFHARIAKTVVKTCREYGGVSRETADDLIQETYKKLIENDFRVLRNFKPDHPDSIYGLLGAVAYSTVVDWFRAVKAQKRWSGTEPIPLDELRGLFLSAADDLDQVVLLAEIEGHLRTQSSRDKTIFFLYYRLGMSARAISALPWVGLKPGGVDSAILRMTRELRERFQSRV